jgi:hypothetical protein
MTSQRERRRGRLPIVLSVTALVVAVLGFTPLGEAGRKFVLPNNVVGAAKIKAKAVKTGKLADRAVTTAKLADNAVTGAKVLDGSLTGADLAAGVIPAAFTGAAAGGDLAGTYPSPTIRDGAVTTAKIGGTPTARVTHNANQAIPGNAAVTVLAFNTERFDSGTLHDVAANNTRITAPVAGIYLVTANITWEANATGARELNIRRNGTTNVARVVQPGDAVNTTDQEAATLVKLAAGDYVEVALRQNSGAPLNVLTAPEFSPELAAVWVAPAPA